MDRYSYSVQPHEPSLFTEIFLPKKAEFQGPLYQTLTAGFRLQHVREHFLEAGNSKRGRIREFLSKGWTVFKPDYTNDEIRAFRRLFFGYSMYEVDGVFLKEKEPKPFPDDRDENYSIDEERTQVIRIIFKYPCSGKPLTVIDFCKAALRDPLSEIGSFGENYPYLRDRLDPEVVAALSDLDNWIRYVGLFLFGYLVFEICNKIVNCDEVKYGQRRPTDIQKDELWVVSLWNLNVNVVEWAQSTGSITVA
jgi:hypothetical protein